VLAVLCGCNQVLGVHGTHLPPPDAPLTCPDFGTPPQYSLVLTQVGTKACFEYTESRIANLAMALCNDSDGMLHVETGAIGGDLSIASDLAEPGWNYFDPRLSASGDDAVMGATSYDATMFGIRRYTRSGSTWTRVADPPLAPTSSDQIGPITQQRHIAIVRSQTLLELDADTGEQLGSYTLQDLGLSAFGDTELGRVVPSLTADGLRLVMLSTLAGDTNSVAVYTDRPEIGARFGTVMPIVGVPHAYDLYMAENCSKIYYSSGAIGALFFAHEVEP